ncbi:MAG TPA: methylated-DNA--[protein]-cysteine S-methyltransferase [Acetobacteraceae bacterium]|nr:methylated-DNA--[protein]-cysteine S-methyltransferase [Acetobacteraceae bacterium]
MRFGRGEAVLGTIVLAASANGVAALFIGGDHTTPLRDLKEAFPDIGFVLDQEGLAETIAKAVALVDASYLGTDLVLDMRGSPVEMAVWDALCAVPPGETRTYSAIAGHLPIAATAQDVAAACAASRIAVAVPCHRVVKSDGSISGCRWGVQRKRRLINMEEVA